MQSRFALASFSGMVLFCALEANATLTHRYSFNDGTANDSVGHVNGTLVNGATVSGGQLVFSPTVNDGSLNPTTGQYVSLPSNILFTQSFTLEAWATDRSTTPWQRILDLGNTEGGGFLILVPYNRLEHVLGQISISDHGGASDTNFVSESTEPATNAQYMYAYVHNLAAGTESLYINGSLVGTAVANQDPTTTNYNNFYIGRSQFSADPYFDGTINELRTYNTGLNASQIAADFANGPDVAPEPGAIAFLGFCACGMLRSRKRAIAPA
jgi:hypothetical protein